MTGPNLGQISLLGVSIGVFVIGIAVSLSRIKWERPGSRLTAKACSWVGIALALAVLIWHSAARGNWLPLEDNFDALIWLGVLLAAFVMYVQRHRPIGGLDWFLMPIVVLMLLAAAIFGSQWPRAYVTGTWSWVHGLTAFGGIASFCVAGAIGLMYLVVNHRLRNKTASMGPRLGSLERLEHVTLISVTLGFALLTIAGITGVVIIMEHRTTKLGPNWLASPKVLLAIAIWVIYALVLHSPINPSFRGRRAAILSIVGCVLSIGVIVAVQFMGS